MYIITSTNNDVYSTTSANDDVYTITAAKPINKGNNTSPAIAIASIPQFSCWQWEQTHRFCLHHRCLSNQWCLPFKPINKGSNTSPAVSRTIASIPVGAYLTTLVNTPVSTILLVPVSNSPLYLYLFNYSYKHFNFQLSENGQLCKSSHLCLTIYLPMLKV